MKYIIMCGGRYDQWSVPRHFTEINSEAIVARTIRLLRENGVEDIAISSNNEMFKLFGVPLLTHKNSWVVPRPHVSTGLWCDCFYPTDEPACYLMGDVVFSPEAIKKIVDTDTDDIEFFASAPPFAPNYMKPWAEPFAFKVKNQTHLKMAQEMTKNLAKNHAFKRPPLAWEFWQVVKKTELNKIDYTNYTVINDYTCDIDVPEDAKEMEKIING